MIIVPLLLTTELYCEGWLGETDVLPSISQPAHQFFLGLFSIFFVHLYRKKYNVKVAAVFFTNQKQKKSISM